MASPTLLSTLSDSDYRLARATESDELRALDEDALLALHARIRRARKKHVGLYRRAAAKRVSTKGSRAAAGRGNADNRARAEIFEDALSRVSRQLGVVAKQSARELKDERLAASRTGAEPSARAGSGRNAAKKSARKAAKKSGASKKPSAVKKSSAAKATSKRSAKTPARKKREASSRAAGARRQARRDSR